MCPVSDPSLPPRLLGHFGDLASLYDRLDEVQHLKIRGAKSLQKKLADNRDAADLARKLTGVVTAVPSTLAAPEVRRKAVDEAVLNRLFDELDFGGMLRQRCLRS